jgi:hypothetical protein
LSWTDLTLALIEETKPSPPQAARALALVHVAMAEAANAGNQPSRAAITGAATTVLEQLFPQPANRIYPQAANPIAAGEEALRRSPAWTHGHARAAGQINLEAGHRIGRQVIAWGQADGSDAAWVGERPVGTGLWQPTPPAYREDPLEPMAGQWQPWVLSSGDALRPAPPPAWGSPSWEAELKGVQEAVAQRTPEQAAAVEFWAGGPGTVTPAGIWITIARDLIVRDGLDARAAAQVLALTSVAMADGFICCWDAKYAYWMARPITADPTLDVLIPTPPFPSYPSGHATVSAAAATVLSHFFPEDAPSLLQQAVEAKNSRLWGGIHFPIDNEVGALAGAAIGQLVIERAAETGVAWNLDGYQASASAGAILSLRNAAKRFSARATRQPAPGVAAR